MEKEIPLGPSSAPSLHLDSNTGNSIAEYYRRLLDVLPDALVLYDLEGRIVYINDSFMQLYGWTRGECYGKKLDFLPPMSWTARPRRLPGPSPVRTCASSPAASPKRGS